MSLLVIAFLIFVSWWSESYLLKAQKTYSSETVSMISSMEGVAKKRYTILMIATVLIAVVLWFLKIETSALFLLFFIIIVGAELVLSAILVSKFKNSEIPSLYSKKYVAMKSLRIVSLILFLGYLYITKSYIP
jgi:hypothetical protein